MTVKLVVYDNENDSTIFNVSKDVVSLSATMKMQLEEISEDEIPITKVQSKTMKHIIDWCTNYLTLDHKNIKPELSDYDKKFCSSMTKEELFSVIEACDYLDIKTLFHVTCRYVGESLRDLSVEQIRELFGVVNDFSPEEEEQLRKENAWLEDA
jgi:S-phase kinase-associated protein 1